MKTTELFVEQVLIGFLVLLVAALVFWADVYAFLIRRSDKSLELIVTGGILVGAAYLIGMVYDRVADTLLQDIESHGRLQFALARFKFKHGKVRTKDVDLNKIEDDNKSNVKNFSDYVDSNTDPFEDGKYRIMVLANSDATAQMEYLRSRIRLTRAMATLIPGLMVAFLLALDAGEAGVWWTIVAVAIPVVYALTLSLKVMRRWKIFYRPPKTYQLKKVAAYMNRGQMLLTDPPRRPWHILKLIAYDEVWLALLALTVATAVLILSTRTCSRLSIVLTGLVLTLIVGWTWWRISITFYAFVRGYAKHGPSKPPA